MNIKQLEAFVRIVKNKSFSQTAKELYLTQPTVSSYISSLEQDLGVQLFNRTTKEVHTTNEGEQIYLYAKDIVNLSNKIRNAFKDDEKEEVNEIIISASSIPAQYLLPGILANFSKRYPNTEFRIHETDSRGAVTDVAEHRADLAFSGSIVPMSNCNFLPFYEDELILVTPNTEFYRNKQADNDLSFLRKAGFCDAGERLRNEEGSGESSDPDGIKAGRIKGCGSLCQYGCHLVICKRGNWRCHSFSSGSQKCH